MGHNPRSLGGTLGAVNAETEGVGGELLALTRNVLRASDPEEALASIATCGVEHVGFLHLVVLGPDESGRSVRVLAAGGLEDAADRRELLPYVRGLASWAERTKLPVGVTGPPPTYIPPPVNLAAALDEILEGRAPSAPQTHSIGCSIKWKKG